MFEVVQRVKEVNWQRQRSALGRSFSGSSPYAAELAGHPELAGQGVEKAIPGVYEPDEVIPAEIPLESGENNPLPVAIAFLLAALLGGGWLWKKKPGFIRKLWSRR